VFVRLLKCQRHLVWVAKGGVLARLVGDFKIGVRVGSDVVTVSVTDKPKDTHPQDELFITLRGILSG
jgi:hypothetical protein